MGDAAHVRSPSGGEGVDAAMYGAAELGRRPIEDPHWRGAVRGFESETFERVAVPAADAVAPELSHDARAMTLEHLRRHAAGAVEASRTGLACPQR